MQPLAGWRLFLFRLARTLGLLYVYEKWCRFRGRWCVVDLDPPEPVRLIFALDSEKIRRSPLERIEITASSFSLWLKEDARSAKGFDAARCFRRVHRDLRGAPARMTAAGIRFHIHAEDDMKLVIRDIERFQLKPSPRTDEHLGVL
jgi:hypothetical protein